MTSYLQMQELWDIVSNDTRPVEPQPTERIDTMTNPDGTTSRRRIVIPPPEEEVAVYNVAFPPWRKENNKALGAITLRLSPQLRHHRTDEA